MVLEELSHLFDKLSRQINADVLDEVRFLIDDYLKEFEIFDDVPRRQMLDELHQHLGTHQLLQLLSDVFTAIDRMDLRNWIWNYALQFPSEDAVRLEESPQRIPGDNNADMETSSASLDNSLCEQPSIDVDNSEAISSHDSSSRSLFHGGLQAEDGSLDSLDISRNHTTQDDSIGPLTSSMQSPQHSSSQLNSSDDSGFSTGAASSTPFHSESSADVDMKLDTPIEMTTEEMKTCIDYNQNIGEGGFGFVFKGEYKKRTVAIKTGRQIQSKERQFLKEKQLAFLRHTFIVPILAYTVDKDEMLMYPYMDNGDLTKVHERLDWKNRLRIFYQCSEGLAFLQRPVQGIRNEIIHGDIKPANILLDANLNARLGDVGVAAELPKGATHCTATANMLYGTEGYEDPFRDEDTEKVVRRKENDVFSLGIVGLQFLKWQPAVQSEKNRMGAKLKLMLWAKLLKEIDPLDARQLISSENFFDKNIWHQDEKDSMVNKEVAVLIVACLQPPKERISAEGLACKLKELLVANNIPKYILTESKSCQYCCFNKAESSPTLILCSDSCPENCKFKCLCRSCHQIAYRNPLYCPEHGRLKQFIRPEECFAVLISGCDNIIVENQKTFDDDVQAMFDVICDPRVMGFSPDNVTLINEITMEKSKEIIKAIQKLQQKDIELLIVYYSGHGNGEDSDPELNICKDDIGNMKDHKLKEYLDSIKCTRLLVILDCCYAARYHVVQRKPRGASDSRLGWRIQLNGAGALKMADITEDNKSVFTRHLVHAINGPWHTCPSADGETDANAPPCNLCTKFKTLCEARGHIDIYDVVGFCSEHIKLEAENDEDDDQETNMMAGELSGSAPLAPYNPKPFTHIFRFQNKEESEKFHLNHLKQEPDQILQQLWDKIKAVCSLPKYMSYRCLKMVGLVRGRENELRTKNELLCQFNRGHIVKVCIRSAGSDIDIERHVVIFCSQHDKFTDVLNSFETAYDSWFKREEPRKDQDLEAEYSCIIKCGETDEITNTWKFPSYDDEKINISDVIKESVGKANTLSRERLRSGKPPISGLRIDVTTGFALLALV